MNARRLWIILSVVVLAVSLAACGDADQREAKYLKRGEVLYEKGEYDKARLEFKNAAQIKPTDSEARYRLGLVDEAQGDLRNAFINFTHAVEQNPRNYPAQLKLASYYFAAEQFGEAETRLDLILVGQPDNPSAHALRGAMLLRRQDYDGAERETKIALAKDPANIGAFSVLAGIYTAIGDDNRAAQVLEDGIARNPKDLSLLVLKANLYQRRGDLAKVAEAYTAIFKLRPADQSYRTQLAELYLKADRLDDAESVLRAGVTAAPDNWEMKRQLVIFLSERRGLDPAEKEIKAYMATDPKNDDLYFWLADLYVKHDAADRAVKLLEQVVEREKMDLPGLNARTSIAQISFSRGDRALAEKLLAVVLEKDPANRVALFVRAGIAFDLGRYQSAVSDLRTVLHQDSGSRQALQLLAEALLRQGHLDLAIDTLDQLADLDPTNGAVRVRLAQMYHLSGDTKRALSLLEMVTKTEPAYAVGWESTARVAIDVKDWPTAEYATGKLAGLEGQKMTAEFLRGEIQRGNGKFEDAIHIFAQVFAADPNAPLSEHALTSLVASYRSLGRLEAATRYIETFDSDNPYVVTLLGEAYQDLKRDDAAAKAFDRAIAAKGHRPEPYVDRARQLMGADKTADAIEVLKLGIVQVPNDIQMPLMMAEAETSAGRYQDAEAIYEDLLGRAPSMDVAANNLAELIADFEYNDPAALERARVVADRFHAAQNPILLDTLGWVYYRLGDMPQATTLLARAATAENAPQQIHYHYGAVLLKDNQPDLAKQQLEIAVKDNPKYPGADEAKRLLGSL